MEFAGPILLGIPAEDTEGDAKVGSTTEDEKRGDESRWDAWRDLPRHRDEDQVQLDVNRSFVYYPNSKAPAKIVGHM